MPKNQNHSIAKSDQTIWAQGKVALRVIKSFDNRGFKRQVNENLELAEQAVKEYQKSLSTMFEITDEVLYLEKLFISYNEGTSCPYIKEGYLLFAKFGRNEEAAKNTKQKIEAVREQYANTSCCKVC